MTLIQIVPIVISVLAFGFSLFTYCKHDSKIKKLTLDKLVTETELEKKAIIEVRLINKDKNKRIIEIHNRGRAIAKNVTITFPGDPSLNIRDYISPIDINPQSWMDIHVSFHVGSPRTLQVDYEWEDGIKLDNRGSQVVQLS